jgi:hypothetical protein
MIAPFTASFIVPEKRHFWRFQRRVARLEQPGPHIHKHLSVDLYAVYLLTFPEDLTRRV